MRIANPPFGIISGIGTGLGLLPQVLTLSLLLIAGITPKSVTSLIIFTVGSKIFGEWLFWYHIAKRMDSIKELKNWRLVLNSSLLSHPNVFTSLLMILVDNMIDVTLIYTALKLPIPFLWIFFTLLGSQMISSPIQGFISDIFSQKKSLIVAALIGLIVSLIVVEIPIEEKPQKFTYISTILGITSLAPTMQMFIVLCFKGIFGNITTIGRASLATVLKVKTLEKFSKV